jgi:hypothetical protein
VSATFLALVPDRASLAAGRTRGSGFVLRSHLRTLQPATVWRSYFLANMENLDMMETHTET